MRCTGMPSIAIVIGSEEIEVNGLSLSKSRTIRHIAELKRESQRNLNAIFSIILGRIGGLSPT
jgi:hypothetical protein